jgi:hypothetical protein
MLIAKRGPVPGKSGPGRKIAWEEGEPLPPGWLPVDISPRTIRWVHAGSQVPTEPFLDRWVAALRSRVPFAREHETEVSWLAHAVGHLPDVTPAGIIFHVTRCGSTLLQNALATGEDVFAVGESAALEKLMWQTSYGEPRAGASASALRDVCKAFGHYRGSSKPQLILKTGGAGVVALRALREIWPNVPCVVVIRDPIQVVVSNLRNPPSMLSEWYDAPSKCCLGSVPDQVIKAGVQEFCVWLVGRICSTALEQLDDRCLVLDYQDLTPEAALRVAEFFSVRFSADGTEALRKTFLSDAKYGNEFKPDAEKKKMSATASMRESVARWATAPYEELLRSSLRLRVISHAG